MNGRIDNPALTVPGALQALQGLGGTLTLLTTPSTNVRCRCFLFVSFAFRLLWNAKARLFSGWCMIRCAMSCLPPSREAERR